MRRFTLATTCLLGSALACDRSEPSRSSKANSAAQPSVTAPATVPTGRTATVDAKPGPHCVTRKSRVVARSVRSADPCPTAPTPVSPLPPAYVTFEDAPHAPRVVVEHAFTPASRERGLMYRTHLNEDSGMLFTWADERPRSFWMHNTCLPLDMLFIDAQDYIVGIIENVPTLDDTPRSVPCAARRVLEVNAGFVGAHGVAPGGRLRIED